jgi:Na+-translocating ferredoxin:NAD+ oxidoreductase RnfC subunit
MPRGTHENSLKNLIHVGRPLDYGEPKKDRHVSVTPESWNKAKSLIDSMGMSVSEFLEELGRGRITIMKTAEFQASRNKG